jgi:MFS family permease
MLYLAVAWDVYQATNSPTALGVVGFCQVIPIMLFAIPAGHLLDRFDRRKIVLIDQFLLGLTGCLMAALSVWRDRVPDLELLHQANRLLTALAGSLHDPTGRFTAPFIPPMLALLFLNGTVRSINQPAKQSLLPQLLPSVVFPNAASWHSSTVETSTMIGPALAGFVLAFFQSWRPAGIDSYAVVYLIMAVCQFVSCGFFARTQPDSVMRHSRPPLTLRSLAGGIHFVWNNKIILATVTLDLLCVLLAGSTALLPAISRDILHCGAMGLGWLRAAPSLGAVSMAVVLAHLPPVQRTGRFLLGAIVCFGAATIAFGLSRNLYGSLLLLFVIGACDNVSSVVRQTVVQMLTPDAMRGRVSSVKSMFSSASDGLGALESGFTAALWGPVASVVMGGVGALVVVPIAALIWPEMRRFGSLVDASSDEVDYEEDRSRQPVKGGSWHHGQPRVRVPRVHDSRDLSGAPVQ